MRCGRGLRVLTSPVMLAGLSLLLANDFLLKPLFRNALTGKLSDFAGLFVFPLFWSALLPRRRREIYALAALGFVFWKSGHSQTLIDGWNSLRVFNVGRVVDASDLIALSALVPSYLYGAKSARPASVAAPPRPAGSWVRAGAAALALFAFAATSYSTDFDYDGQEFFFADSVEGVVKRLRYLGQEVQPRNAPAADGHTVYIKADMCFDKITALVEIKALGDRRSRIVLRELSHSCPEGEDDKSKMLTIFLREVVGRLQDDIDAHPGGPDPSKLRRLEPPRPR